MNAPARSRPGPGVHFRALALTLFLFLPSLAASQVNVLTHHNDTSRTGQNLQETLLTTANVNMNGFGKLFSRSVDGQIFAQPLYMSDLPIQGAMHNVVFVATMHNSVYAFDADDPNAGTPLWQVNLGPSVPSQDICTTCSYTDITPEIGILSTPVIDPVSQTIYVVAKTKRSSDSTYHFHLHALDITSGAEKFGGPTEIAGQVPGTGSGSVGGQVPFIPLQQLNRPGLLLAGGNVYLGFGAVGDIGVWHGWLFAYNATTLTLVDIFNTSPNGCCGSIWQSGQGLLPDASGNLYFMTGNGTFNANTGGTEYGDSFVKLSPSFAVADYFTPYNQATLDGNDADLGSGGPVALPGTRYIVGIGKDGILRLIDTTNMGKYSSNRNNDVQEFLALAGGTANSSNPVYWNSPNNGPVIYVWGQNDFIKAFKFTGSSFQTTPVSQGTVRETPGYSNAAPLSLSANGTQAGSGIVWASGPSAFDADKGITPGILHAFDATNLAVELWNSKQDEVRDDVGNYAKFSPPTVANGKVYLATFSGQLLVYGLNPPPIGLLPAPWSSQDVGTVGVAGRAGYSNGTYSLSGSGADIWGTSDGFRYAFQPLSGDGQIVARVATLQNTAFYAKGGVMIRETLAANSTHAMMDVTPGGGAEFSRRLTTGGTTPVTALANITAPYWVKVVRSGNTFSGYVAQDGINWVLVGSDTINMASTAYIGLIVNSHDNTVLCTATFDNVTLTGGATTAVSITAPTNGATYAAPATVQITASATAASGASITRVDFYAGAVLVGSASTTPYTVTWSNVAAGSYSLTATATDSAGGTATSSPVSITVTTAGLPAPWATQDIGTVGVSGSAAVANGSFTLSGSGADIGGTADAFRYVYKRLAGNGQIIARVASLQNTNANAKGGVMIRETLAANSANVMMDLTPGSGAAFSQRTKTGAATTSTAQAGVAAPYWVKLVRTGNTITGYLSSDGVNWVKVGSGKTNMASSVYVGLVVTSHDNTVLCTTTIDGVQ